MKRIIFPVLLSLLLAVVSCEKKDNAPRLVIITFDGLRWVELFGGADSTLTDRTEPRDSIFPFIWSYVPEHGYLLGNRLLGSKVDMSNRFWFSYPGYSEIFCGYADDGRITSNDAVPNPNTSVLEVAGRDPRYAGRVMVYASWRQVKHAVGCERGVIPGSSAYDPGLSDTEFTRLLDKMQEGMPRIWGGERFDAFTYAYALESLRKDHPKVLYVSLGETDEWAHARRYDRYLSSARATDAFIRGIVETCEADPFYKGRTTYLVTTDHGRGYGNDFPLHGDGSPGSGETFFLAFGRGIPVLGEVSDAPDYKNRQIAATIAEILDIDFVPDNGIRQEAIHPERPIE